MAKQPRKDIEVTFDMKYSEVLVVKAANTREAKKIAFAKFKAGLKPGMFRIDAGEPIRTTF